MFSLLDTADTGITIKCSITYLLFLILQIKLDNFVFDLTIQKDQFETQKSLDEEENDENNNKNSIQVLS